MLSTVRARMLCTWWVCSEQVAKCSICMVANDACITLSNLENEGVGGGGVGVGESNLVFYAQSSVTVISGRRERERERELRILLHKD